MTPAGSRFSFNNALKQRAAAFLKELEERPGTCARWGRRISFFFTLLALALFAWQVDLTPQVDPHFFFSSNDPRLLAQAQISKLFPELTQVIFSARGNLESPEYLERIDALTEALEDLPGIQNVYSLTQGPRSPKDAARSPFWKRILIAEDGHASNLFAFIKGELSGEEIRHLEALRSRFEAPDFALILSGIPYITELIRRNLLRDLQVFSLAAFLIFGAAIWLIFHSPRMVVGTALACISAAAASLVISQLLGVRIGLLTANLVTIVFVMTLSHILFLTFNWRYLILHASPDKNEPTPLGAVRKTLEPSFWSMLTTLLGFVSLLFVQALPLRALGVSGAIGTALAFLLAFGMYIWFLPAKETLLENRSSDQEPRDRSRRFFKKQHPRVVAVLSALSLLASTGIWRLQTDPSLLSYFQEGSPLYERLTYIDRNIGSSPLQIVVRDKEKKRLNTTEAYQKLWNLHEALERDPAVGSALSLPLIMAEAKRVPVISLLPWEWLFELMEHSSYRQVANQFVTEDRERGFFMLMMKEAARGDASRLETIERLRQTVHDQGFEPELVGGVYALQGHMARLVTSSLASGLVMLILLFVAMGRFLSHSLEVALAMWVSLCLIPMWLLGCLGHLKVPFDIISSPAANIAIGMGVDAMIHLLVWVRHHSQAGPVSWQAWGEALRWLWRPIVYSAATIMAGFGIFGLSAFPPTQRFGFSIVIGTLIAPPAALFVLPLFSNRLWLDKKSGSRFIRWRDHPPT